MLGITGWQRFILLATFARNSSPYKKAHPLHVTPSPVVRSRRRDPHRSRVDGPVLGVRVRAREECREEAFARRSPCGSDPCRAVHTCVETEAEATRREARAREAGSAPRRRHATADRFLGPR